MKRILWIGPILSVFMYASGGMGADANPHLAPRPSKNARVSKPKRPNPRPARTAPLQPVASMPVAISIDAATMPGNEASHENVVAAVSEEPESWQISDQQPVATADDSGEWQECVVTSCGCLSCTGHSDGPCTSGACAPACEPACEPKHGCGSCYGCDTGSGCDSHGGCGACYGCDTGGHCQSPHCESGHHHSCDEGCGSHVGEWLEDMHTEYGFHGMHPFSSRGKCSKIFFGAEFLTWWSRGQDLIPLIAAGDGLPPAPTLFGGRRVGDEVQAAVRITAGYWLGTSKEAALMFRGYGGEGSDVETSGVSDGTPGFSIPFINDGATFPGLPDALILAEPGVLQPGVPATVNAKNNTDILGGDVLYRRLWRQGCGYRVDLLAGYQYSHLDDRVTLATTTNRATAGNPTFSTFDRFNAENNYNAGEVGLLFEGTRGPLTVQLMGKLGMGNMNSKVEINGFNTVDGVPSGGGIFAQDQSAAGGPTFNIGNYERDDFALSPEISVKTIWSLRERLDFTFGYTFLYWSDVVLAGDQMDRRLNSDVFFDGAFVPGGGSNPSFAFQDTDYWVHTLDFGMLFRY